MLVLERMKFLDRYDRALLKLRKNLYLLHLIDTEVGHVPIGGEIPSELGYLFEDVFDDLSALEKEMSEYWEKLSEMEYISKECTEAES